MGILYIRNENDEFVAIPALKGDKGEDGFSPIITENINNTDEIYQLDIETADGKFTTPNLKGNGVEAPTEEFEGESSGDVAWTTATVNSGIGYATNSSSGYTTKYAIKNNVVYVNSNIICNTVKDNGYDTLISGLPAPSTYLFFTLQPDTYGNAPIYVQVDENGNLKLRSGTAGKTYMLSISYPII